MGVATYTKTFLKTARKSKQLDIRQCCSICGKKLKFHRTTDNPLACWECMAINEWQFWPYYHSYYVVCHGLSSTSIDTWEDITIIRIMIIMTYNNALSSSHWNNYHSPNHPSSRVVCVSGASESCNHTAKTINRTGMHTIQLWLSGLANSVVLSWRLKAKLLEGSCIRSGSCHCRLALSSYLEG